MKKALLFVAIVFVGGVAYYVYAGMPKLSETQDTEMSREGTTPAENEARKSELYTISFTEAGYDPKSITIRKGDTVRFVNNATSQDTWPASAVHPTHSIYPEKTSSDCLGSAFDACRGLRPGESWEFTFNQAGEWRFHDHNHASKTGVILVE